MQNQGHVDIPGYYTHDESEHGTTNNFKISIPDMPFQSVNKGKFDFSSEDPHFKIEKAIKEIFDAIETLYGRNVDKINLNHNQNSGNEILTFHNVSEIKKAMVAGLARRLIVIATNDKSFANKVSTIYRKHERKETSKYTLIVHIDSSCDEIVNELYNLKDSEISTGVHTVYVFDSINTRTKRFSNIINETEIKNFLLAIKVFFKLRIWSVLITKL